jgi:hypothetical protein
MLLPMVLSIVIIGQTPASTPSGAFTPPATSNAEKENTTTLIVVASTGGDPGETEFLVMRAAGGTISWSFICPRGFTKEGVDPEGEAEETGTIAGDSKLLTGAFRAMLGEITEKKQPKRAKTQRVPADFSLILIDSAGVKTCQLLSTKQRMRLVHGDDLKAVFSEVRKKVFGVGYLMPDLLQVGTNPDLGEPKVPVQGGPNWRAPQLPPSPSGKK